MIYNFLKILIINTQHQTLFEDTYYIERKYKNLSVVNSYTDSPKQQLFSKEMCCLEKEDGVLPLLKSKWCSSPIYSYESI